MSSKAQHPIKNYDKEWKKVDALAKKNLPKSAFTEVKKIYEKAKLEKQDAQVLKALIYMSGLQTETREDNETFSIRELEAEIIISKQPVTSVLKNVLANVYLDYFNNNRWKLYDRTKTAAHDKFDITKWSAEDFHHKISELFLQSIKEEKLLQQTKLEVLDAVIIKGNTRHLRPTLYDLLAHSALEYFMNDERDIKQPAYAFEIDQSTAYAPAAEFVTKKFITKDSASLKHKALLIYQKLLTLHLNDEKPDALMDADIKRLEFVNNHSAHPDKQVLYINALNQLANKYGDRPAAAQAWFLIASDYEQKANGYKPFGDTTHRYARVKAKEICEKVLTQKTESEGWVNCYNLLNAINSQSFDFDLEKINVPGQAFRALIGYANISSLYFRVVKADEKLKADLENRRDEKYWPTLIKAPSLKNWQQDFPDPKDYRHHNTEIKVDGLPVGEYFLLASPDKEFNEKKSLIGTRMFYVSNISFVNNDKDYFVLHRETGQPLAKANVQVWEQRYDNRANKYIKEKNKLYQTDENGYFQVEKYNTQNDQYGNFRYLLEVTTKDDRLFTDDVLNNYYYINGPAEPKAVTRIFLFTDRSLYRPGQTLHLKGIALTSTGTANNKVLENFSTKVYLRDANYQNADSLEVKTNEFGSFSVKFQLPSSGLNGQFTIYTENNTGTVSFRMEEYKRPKFLVEYEPLKGTYKVNDKIKITGTAKAYAGNNIDGASVKYRVVREPRFLYPWLFRRWWQPPTQEMEIAHGETKTDKDGKFTVEFEAIPDLTIEKKFEPVFDYTVYADVTDINGETRSGEKSVSVSYKSLILKTAVAEFLPADSLKDLYIRTENMNGEYEPAKVNVKFTKLKEEKRLIRDRYWERPDQFVMTKDEYIKHFPVDEYDNETDYKNWAKGEISFNKTDSVKSDGEWKLQNAKMNPGFYEIEISTKDKNGEEVKDIKYIELYDEKNNKLTKPEYLWTGLKNLTVEPGETARLEMGTAADNLFVIHQVQKQNKAATGEKYIFQQLNNEKKTFSFAAAETDRGGYGISWLFVKHNRYYQLNQTINVPWTNKDLKIEYTTFRDKTLPGSEEKWKLKISGYKKDKIAAEMLASMYDASLDQFYPHYWYKPSIWYNYSNQLRWAGNINFSGIQSSHNYIPEKEYKNFVKQYDILMASYVFSPYYRNSTEPLWWLNPLDYIYGETRNPRLMRLSKNGKRGEGDVMGDFNAAMPMDADDGYAFRGKNFVADPTKFQHSLDTNEIPGQFDKDETKPKNESIQVRKNFNETAFFLPDLKTNENGDIEFSFTMPEALTKWKFQALAHTKDLAFGYSSKEIITQKELMVQPNAPRFLREGDKIEFSGKIVNLTDKEITGQVQLQLFDAATNEPVDGRFRNAMANQYFTVAAGQSEAVSFPLEIPFQFNKALVWRIVAKAGDKSDGEENTLPVLTNRMLVTETMPLTMRGIGTKEFKFEKLLKAGSSSSLQHHALTVEYTSNPVWYAVQALPYLMEYPYECSEQTWNRYYANALASMIANSSPRIKQIFESWKTKDTAALMSNLQKNGELKAVLLEETPWVLQAKNEEQQKKNIALLFDLIRMGNEMNSAYEKLKQMQSSAGGFVWFKGGPDNPYITQYIITGIGHLNKLIASWNPAKTRNFAITEMAIPYLDGKIKEEYDQLKKSKADLNKYTPDYYEVQYLYMRSFFPEIKIESKSQAAYNYFRSRAQKTWTKQSKYMQGMIALALHRTGDAKTPAAIIKSLTETSINHEELGMYWKELTSGGYYWYQAPIETHSLLIEVFSEVSKDAKTIDDLKTWLLKNKQTANWKTTKATAEACYALLLQGTNWLTTETTVEIKTGNAVFSSNDNKAEAGAGYFKKNIEGDKVKSEMGNITLNLSTQSPNQPVNQSTSWGGVYWQYFEDLDKITSASTPLKLEKKLFVEKNTDRGPVLTPVNDGDFLKAGDKIKVQIVLRADRDMEYVHMKDMRASCMEPVNVLSSYKWQGGLGYYETTKDASTNFFIDYLRKGTYVFEYPLFVTNKGNFSNGITTIQCMYAPEFSSHSEGVRVNVE